MLSVCLDLSSLALNELFYAAVCYVEGLAQDIWQGVVQITLCGGMLNDQLVPGRDCHVYVYAEGTSCFLVSVGYLDRHATTNHIAADSFKLGDLLMNQALDGFCLLNAFESYLNRSLHSLYSIVPEAVPVNLRVVLQRESELD